MKKLFGIGMVYAVVFGLLVNCAKAEAAPPIPKEKKIIGFAPDLVDNSYLKDNIAELERIPIDGLIISVQPYWKEISEGISRGRIHLADGQKFEREDYKQAIADLKETKFTRFTDNFIDF